jgi:hypothetical protein
MDLTAPWVQPLPAAGLAAPVTKHIETPADSRVWEVRFCGRQWTLPLRVMPDALAIVRPDSRSSTPIAAEVPTGFLGERDYGALLDQFWDEGFLLLRGLLDEVRQRLPAVFARREIIWSSASTC